MRNFYFTQYERVCDRAVDDLDISNAYEVFSTERKEALDHISQIMLQYLNRR